MEQKLRKCKTCGRRFIPKEADGQYCSPMCRATGNFVGGGGDRTKPISREMKRALEKEGKPASSPNAPKPSRSRCGPEKFPRVHQMFSIPAAERWALASTFTKEEAEYGRRLAKKQLQEEWKLDKIIDWDGYSEERESAGGCDGMAGGSLGDSDDGTI